MTNVQLYIILNHMWLMAFILLNNLQESKAALIVPGICWLVTGILWYLNYRDES